MRWEDEQEDVVQSDRGRCFFTQKNQGKPSWKNDLPWNLKNEEKVATKHKQNKQMNKNKRKTEGSRHC